MSFLDRITSIEEMTGNDEEAAAFARGNDGGYHRRMQSRTPKAIMVRPAGATWDYNPVPVRQDVNHGKVAIESDDSLDSILEDIASIDEAFQNLFD
jgi:hypothetical protein